ncbi:general secretion pathway protein GspB [Shewanella gelidimarina]|uniref:general secretion pathway protein GspB n=1 Tax=Shewanella gelidimarina TaxID=56813 RepID=UPI00200D117B|nr:general secretion pathway protein GspB [Shewanella gelidimarina]MCL1056836.1 general secretion pathway protein GspB [Shewanella gelidimarina]
MSILLDAVTRDKQQSQGIQHDVVMTPRAQYKTVSHEHKMAKRAVAFAVLLLLSVALAWLLSQIFMAEKINNDNVANQTFAMPAEQNKSNTSGNVQSAASRQFEANDASIKLAGKVALPVVRAMPNSGSQARQTSFVPAGRVTTSNDAAGNDLLAAVLKAQQSVEADDSPAEVKRQAVSNEPDPIILGANANQRGQDMLASLQYEVDLAAADVGLDSKPKPQNDNNLVAAFEAALKDIERENAFATPVTQPALDPIPTTPKTDSIPKYGQLPAGLQLQVPEFSINAHVYSSVEDNRWLNVDGAELQQGDKIQGKLTIVEIRPRDVVLSIQGTEFKVPAI